MEASETTYENNNITEFKYQRSKALVGKYRAITPFKINDCNTKWTEKNVTPKFNIEPHQV